MNGPIFLAGVAKSGKTLLRLALTSHPRIAISRRTYMWTRVYGRYGDLRERANFERCLAAMLDRRPIRMLNPDPDRIRREFRQGEPTYARLFALFHVHYAERLGRARWGDQLGMVEQYTDTIFAAYPDAKMIHLIRDPRDRFEAAAISSRLRIGAVGMATARWVHSATLALRNQRRYSGRYKVVHCEELVSQLEDTLREICAFLDEDFLPGMLTMEAALRFGNEDDEAYRESGANTGPGRPDERYGVVLSKREIAFIQSRAGKEMEAFGYEPEPTRFSLIDRLLYHGVDWPANMAGIAAGHLLLTRQLAA